MLDRFQDDQQSGNVLGTRSAGGGTRLGVDSEGVIGIDHGALRIQPLVKPGWRRCGIAYGPYQRENGLAFGAYLLNGHNGSQAEPLPESFKSRLKRWALGSEAERVRTRMVRLLRARQSKLLWRRLWHWIRLSASPGGLKRIDQNLAVGWFPSEAPSNPLEEGNGFVVHSIGPELGELWTRVGSSCQPVLHGIQNVPMYYVVVLRERGAAYYAASLPGVRELAAIPTMRPLAIDPFHADQHVFAGIHQCVLGQIGFRVDTRVYGAQVAKLPSFAEWYGSAQGADRLSGGGLLHQSEAQIGGAWKVLVGEFRRSEDGTAGECPTNSAILQLPSPSGLIQVLVSVDDRPIEGVAVLWRVRDEQNYWHFEAESEQCQLSIVENGVRYQFPATRRCRIAPNAINCLQVADDGLNIRLVLNGEIVYETVFADGRLESACGTGFQVRGTSSSVILSSFEAHPRVVPVPSEFELGQPWLLEGNHVVASDDFSGPSAELTGRNTSRGGRSWNRLLGKGVFHVTGNGTVKVDASVARPNPGRTAYAIPWEFDEFADLKVNITPPGTRKGQEERGRGGVIFWQDPENYITLNLWMSDDYGFSISSFFHIDGYEELYDAVWTNIGRRVHWGVPFDLRVAFDGNHYLAKVNQEPVLYRALTDVYPDLERLAIRRVGILANWEWGNDTGSVFRDFVARAVVPNGRSHNGA